MMLNTEIVSNKEFKAGGSSYKSGDVIRITEDEKRVLDKILELDTTRSSIEDRLLLEIVNGNDSRKTDPVLEHIYSYRKRDSLIIELTNKIHRRIGGVVPISIDISGDTKEVKVKTVDLSRTILNWTNESVEEQFGMKGLTYSSAVMKAIFDIKEFKIVSELRSALNHPVFSFTANSYDPKLNYIMDSDLDIFTQADRTNIIFLGADHKDEGIMIHAFPTGVPPHHSLLDPIFPPLKPIRLIGFFLKAEENLSFLWCKTKEESILQVTRGEEPAFLDQTPEWVYSIYPKKWIDRWFKEADESDVPVKKFEL